MDNKNSPKTRHFHTCVFCNYTCSKKSDFNKHNQTKKHLDKMDNKNSPKTRQTHIQSEYICNCGKIYRYQSGLCKHKRFCQSGIINDCMYPPDTMHSTDNTQNQFINLLRQNQEFKELILEQNKTILELSTRTNTNMITHNTTNNNQRFNLNFFLNTTCKDAMNMSDFIENMEVSFKDIENIGKHGYVTGMTDMILSRIKELDITKRPLHCTDLKRETMYIKDNDEWYKDTPDNRKLHRMIDYVAKRNYAAIPLWREEHPECQVGDHPQYDFCVSMMRNILGDVGTDQIRLDNKVIKNLSKHVFVDKK